MIICGYVGIGKSTIAESEDNVVDLESSIFRNDDGSRPDNWEEYYCKMAEHLSRQGTTVFVSTHPEVLKYLKEKGTEPVMYVYPAKELKEEWVGKLKARYEKSGTEKDRRAYISVEDNFDSHIDELSKAGFTKVEITRIKYQLSSLITWVENWVYEFPEARGFRLS